MVSRRPGEPKFELGNVALASAEAKKTRCFENAPQNKKKVKKEKKKKAEKRKTKKKGKKKKEKKTRREEAKERRKSRALFREANYTPKLPIIRACRGRYVK